MSTDSSSIVCVWPVLLKKKRELNRVRIAEWAAHLYHSARTFNRMRLAQELCLHSFGTAPNVLTLKRFSRLTVATRGPCLSHGVVPYRAFVFLLLFVLSNLGFVSFVRHFCLLSDDPRALPIPGKGRGRRVQGQRHRHRSRPPEAGDMVSPLTHRMVWPRTRRKCIAWLALLLFFVAPP